MSTPTSTPTSNPNEAPDWTAWKAYLDNLIRGSPPITVSTRNGNVWQWEHFLAYGLKSYFIARQDNLQGLVSLADPNDFWKQIGYLDTPVLSPYEGVFRLPTNIKRVAIHSIYSYKYPHIMADIALPNVALYGNETQATFSFGAENGAGGYNGVFAFLHYSDNTPVANRLMARSGSLDYIALTNPNVTLDLVKPLTSMTANHVYRILLGRNLCTYTIDGAPVHFAVPCNRMEIVKNNTRPYSVQLVTTMPESLTPFLEWWTDARSVVATQELTSMISPHRYRFTEGQEVNPMALPLYEEDTATTFAGKVIAAGSLTSHPFPTMGYASKSLFFRATQNGTLSLQTYTESGNWREFDTITTVANQLHTILIPVNSVLTRVVFTPAAFPCTVAEGEVNLS